MPYEGADYLRVSRGGAIEDFITHNSVAEEDLQRRCGIGGWAALAASVAVATFVSLAYLYVEPGDQDLHPSLLIVLAIASAVLAGMYARQRWLMVRLHRSIVDAQEGILEPLEFRATGAGYVGRVVADYNRMVTSLRTMFSMVEECQGRFVGERNKLNALLQSLPGAVLGVDDNLRINAVNRISSELFALPQEHLIGVSLFDVLHLEERDRDVLRDAFLYKQQLRNQEIEQTVNGHRRFVSLNLSFLTEQDADMGAVIALQDMTEYKQLQEGVAMREKFVAMGQFAAGVAHELNTPLGNVLGFSQLLREGKEEPDKRARYLEIIVEETKRCSRIIQDLLNYARKERCEGDACDINAMVREVVDTFVSCRMKRLQIALDLQLSERPVMAQGGCGELEIILTNLMVNAIQALKDAAGGRITIRTASDGHGSVVLAAEDNGPGVPRAIRNRIFDPFFTTKEVGEGSGLGLAIGQAMLSKRGGSIRLDPDYDAGARFVVTLPEQIERCKTND